MSLLGIDIGTSGCKAAVFAEDGHLLGLAYEEYDYRCPQPGWAELDSPTIWKQVKDTIRQVIMNNAKRDPVEALCVSLLGESVVPFTANRQILGPALLDFDTRGEEYLDRLRGLVSDYQLYQTNGNTLGNQFTLPK